jgi:hypothetical protein
MAARKTGKKSAGKKSTAPSGNRSVRGTSTREKKRSSAGILKKAKKVLKAVVVGAAAGAAKGAVQGAVEAGSEAAGIPAEGEKNAAKAVSKTKTNR